MKAYLILIVIYFAVQVALQLIIIASSEYPRKATTSITVDLASLVELLIMAVVAAHFLTR